MNDASSCTTTAPNPASQHTQQCAEAELQQLIAVKDTLIKLPCSPEVEPIIDELSGILALAQDGGNIDVGRLKTLVHTARAKG